jgi:hypothetical protein
MLARRFVLYALLSVATVSAKHLTVLQPLRRPVSLILPAQAHVCYSGYSRKNPHIRLEH